MIDFMSLSIDDIKDIITNRKNCELGIPFEITGFDPQMDFSTTREFPPNNVLLSDLETEIIFQTLPMDDPGNRFSRFVHLVYASYGKMQYELSEKRGVLRAFVFWGQ